MLAAGTGEPTCDLRARYSWCSYRDTNIHWGGDARGVLTVRVHQRAVHHRKKLKTEIIIY